MKKVYSIFRNRFVSMFLSICCIFLMSAHVLATTYTVNALTDSGTGAGTTGDLRYCINQANGAAGPHTINFSVAGSVTLTSTLPVIIQQIAIMGNTAPGYTVATPKIELNGNGAAAWIFLFNGSAGAGSNSTLRGLVMNRATLTNVEVDAGVNGLTIQDCFIGTNITGTASAGTNPNFGIQLVTSSNNFITNNIISGHATHGLLINVNSNSNTVKGNKIGCNLLGTAAIPNAFHGMEINNTSINNIIGGAAVADRNIISGNTKSGISIVGSSSGVQIINNYVGVTLAGTGILANLEHGIIVNGAASATVTNNVVSGNGVFGVFLTNADNHIVKGNKIGVNAAGTAAIANALTGLRIEVSNNPIVGGTAAGEGNTISGNGEDGLRFQSVATATIQGNFIGTNSTGTAVISNTNCGIYATTNCTNHTVGGNTVAARNVISGNGIHGLQYDTGSNDLIVQGNYIGTNGSGAGAPATFGNGQCGIFLLNNCLRPLIGGGVAQRNIISGNGRLWISGTNNGTGILCNGGITSAVITGNYIGLAADGSTATGNAENGIVMLYSNNATIGGNSAALRNIVSSNGKQGIVLSADPGTQITGTVVIGNYCGLDAGGTLARGNGQSGIISIFGSNGFFGRANAGEGNVLSNNGEQGLHLVGGSGNTAYNNIIGLPATGSTAMGNKNGGVYIQGVGSGTNGSNNIIGGLGALQPNTIANATNTGINPLIGNGFGIGVAHNDQGLNNVFIGNKIYCNAGLGIDLDFSGAFGGAGTNNPGNGGKTAPAITAVTNTTTSGTGTNGETIHVYSNVTCTTCQGETYLGSATVAGGVWTVTHVSVAAPYNNSATATNGTQGTSQFTCNFALPVELVYFKAKAENTVAVLTWSTAMEKNNASFVIERSADGVHFEDIANKTGQGNTLQVTNYEYTDAQPLKGISYYRLKQIDFDGTSTYSKIESVSFQASTDFFLFPNPAKDEINVVLNSDEVYTIRVYSNLGVEMQQLNTTKNNNTYTIHLNGVAAGSYILEVSSTSQQVTKSFLVY